MKFFKVLMLCLGLAMLTGCNSDDDAGTTPQEVNVVFTFSHYWDGSQIQNSDFDQTSYVNAHGETLTLSKLVYLISDITFTAQDGTVYSAEDYNLVNVREGQYLSFTPNVLLPEGAYTVSFTFGFDDEDNSGNYPDLNSADGGWNVPDMLGGGYHYMRMEGKYLAAGTTDEVNFQYHTIRANKHTTLPPGPDTLELLEDTSFEVNLGEINITAETGIEIDMNVAEWFKNPNTWDLTQYYTVLMPNYEAQILMYQNGKNGVFGLGATTVP